MKANRIVFALALAGLAGPALAEKCHICDFSDEPIVVKPTKSSGTPSVSEIVVTKLSDVASPSFDSDRPVLRGTVPNTGELARYNFTTGWPSKAGAAQPLASEQAAALPQPAQGGGMGAGKANFGDFGSMHQFAKPMAPVPGGSRPLEHSSMNYYKLESRPVGPNAAPAGPGFRR